MFSMLREMLAASVLALGVPEGVPTRGAAAAIQSVDGEGREARRGSSVRADYASRESSAPELEDFRGGYVIIVTTVGFLVVLLILLIIF